MLRKLPYGANYLNYAEMSELRQALEEKILFRYQTIVPSAASKLEEHVQDKFKVLKALGCHNCTESLRLSLLATRPKIGDPVYIPSVSFVAVAGAVLSCGLIPVIVDVDENFCLDASRLPAAIERLILVHMEGTVNPFPSGIPFVIEDCAQAMGGQYPDGAYVGTKGFAGCFSFHHNKVLTSGEGGLIVTNNTVAWERMRQYHDHGCQRKQGEYPTWSEDAFYGENCVISEVIAAIQLQQMRHLDEIQEGLERGYRILLEALSPSARFVVRRRQPNDVKLSLRLEFESHETRTAFENILKRKSLPFWTLEKYYLPDHPVFKIKGSIYGDGFPWNLAPQDIFVERDFSKTRDRLLRTICISVSPEYTQSQQFAEAEKYRQAIGQL